MWLKHINKWTIGPTEETPDFACTESVKQLNSLFSISVLMIKQKASLDD